MNYVDLDPGIRDTVRLLHAHGFETSDSGDGCSKPADERVFDCPHVVAASTPETMVADAHRLADLLGDGWVVEASYATDSGHALLVAMCR